MDSVEARAIVDALNKPPFNKEFTLIGFDAQAPLQLLQVCCAICPFARTRGTRDAMY